MSGAARTLLLILVLVGIVGLPAPAAAETDLAGMYVAEGVNPDGSRYSGLVQITRHGESFLVSWIFAKASSDAIVLELSSVGVGIVSEATLAVSFYGANSAGVGAYRIEQDGQQLVGHWTAAGGDGTGHSETLSKLPPPDSEPADGETPGGQVPPQRRTPVRSSGTLEL